MLQNPAGKYRPFHQVQIRNRTWPDNRLTKAPIWMSTDLRDGNQALFEPMDAQRKMRMFKTLVAIGFTEIEDGFPSASQTDFDFIRELITGGHIPEDVTIEVLTQARDELIERTMESLRGARRAIVHVYNDISEPFRRPAADRMGLPIQPRDLHRHRAGLRQGSGRRSDGRLAADAPAQKVIVNCPATVEVATPNIYADQIEWMHRNLAHRDSLILSVHPHNDRGTAVAAAELAVMAGADHVDGCLSATASAPAMWIL